MLPLFPILGILIGVLFGAFAIALELNPEGVAAAVGSVPVIGPLLVTDCFRCDTPVLRARAEDVPVVIPNAKEEDELTIRFCDECSLTMTFEDRVALLKGEAEKRSDWSE